METKLLISTITALAISSTVFALTANGANSAERVSAKPAKNVQLKVGAGRAQNNQASNIPFNEAPAWTAGCMAEFGPDSKDPDPKLLEICLNK